MTTGQRIKQLRILRGFPSQQSFADALGVTQGYISDIESSKLDLRLSTLVKIARKLGVKPGALLDAQEFRQAAQLAAAVQSAAS